jgi:6-pyruvoyltetrahydropterin/6-carboxytetrahydropterin synthase
VDDKVVDTKGVSDEGMVIDFSDLKVILMEEIDSVFDHSFTIYEQDEFIDDFKKYKNLFKQKINVVSFIPTAENLAMHWYRLIEDKLKERGIAIKYVKVWETPTSTAVYTSDDNKKYVDKGQATLSRFPQKPW